MKNVIMMYYSFLLILLICISHSFQLRRKSPNIPSNSHRKKDFYLTQLHVLPISQFISITSKLESKLLSSSIGNTKGLTNDDNLINDGMLKSLNNINVFESIKPLIEKQMKSIENLINSHNIFSTFSNSMKIPDALKDTFNEIQNDLLHLTTYLNEQRSFEGIDYSYTAIIEGLVSSLLVSAIFNSNSNFADNLQQPYGPEGKYNATLAEKYFSSRLNIVLYRSLEIAFKSSSFIAKLLINYVTGKINDPIEMSKRADEIVTLLTELGPTFIKVGQSLSIRTDLLNPAYIKSLAQLQDRVSSFPTPVAKSIIAEEFNMPVDELFSSGLEDNAQVVAAASLGQVYKATLRSDGSTVAVKVQRPNIIINVALDMYIIRNIAPVLKKIFNWDSNVLGIVDDWGKGFVNELDYYSEARNEQIFTESIRKTPLKDVVFAPEVIPSVSRKRVLTTRWVDGERIEKSNPTEVTALCNIAMNTYLSMLLETPILHCDPHPGNLRRTPDGRLCIMDWGLVTSVDPDIQTTLIAHVSHLVAKDYTKVPSDLVKLGFVPKGKEQVILDNGVVEVLADIYGRWATGGGVAKIDINAVVNQVSGLTAKYGNLFQLPPYFAYIARAFSVLEGIGLSIDPNYSIINECLPYISKRLLTDPNVKTEDALKTFIYGPNKDNHDRLIDTERLRLLVKGFGKYSEATDGLDDQITYLATTTQTSSSSSVLTGSVAKNISEVSNVALKIDDSSDSNSNTNTNSDNDAIVEQIESITDQIFDLLFSNNPTSSSTVTPIQRIVIDEIGKVIGATTRLAWARIRDRSGRLPSGRSIAGTLLDPIGIFSGSNLVEVDDYDRRVLQTTSELVDVLQQYLPMSFQDVFRKLKPAQIQLLASSLLSRIWLHRNQIQSISFSLVSQILRQTAQRVDNQVNRTINPATTINRSILSDRSVGSNTKTSTTATTVESSSMSPNTIEVSPRVALARELAAIAKRETI